MKKTNYFPLLTAISIMIYALFWAFALGERLAMYVRRYGSAGKALGQTLADMWPCLILMAVCIVLVIFLFFEFKKIGYVASLAVLPLAALVQVLMIADGWRLWSVLQNTFMVLAPLAIFGLALVCTTECFPEDKVKMKKIWYLPMVLQVLFCFCYCMAERWKPDWMELFPFLWLTVVFGLLGWFFAFPTPDPDCHKADDIEEKP